MGTGFPPLPQKAGGNETRHFLRRSQCRHTENDLANPKTNRKNAGFTDEERSQFQALLDAGFVDTFRLFTQGNGHYTWWSYMNQARPRNIGWRIDYFLVSAELVPRVKSARILPHVPGSDHCPVVLELR